MNNGKMDDVKKVLDRLDLNYRKCDDNRKDNEVGEFDLIGAVGGCSINENAHTRILAALLAIRPVRKLFWSVLVRKYPQRGLERLIQCEVKVGKADVCCFENYIDACITIGECKVILENKVKGANDQPGQIDRYVDLVNKCQGVHEENIFVLYVTQRGGSPSCDSFEKAKETLGCNGSSDSGRFFEVDYLHDILPFLYELLGRRVEQNLAENVRESFRGGVMQYVNYIEGSNLLGLRESDDGYGDFRKAVRDELDEIQAKKFSLTDFFTYAEWLLLRNRRTLEMTTSENDCFLFDKQDIEVKRSILRYRFYSMFGIAVPDDEFYVPVYFDNNAVVSMGMWDDLEGSIVQVDFWSDAPDGDYDKAIKALEDSSKALNDGSNKFQYRVMNYNNHDMIRFRIATLDDLSKVINLLSETPNIGKPMNGNMAATVHMEKADGNVCGNVYPEEMIRQMKLAANSSRSESQAPSASDLWSFVEVEDGEKKFRIDHRYSYRNGWAIQLYESPDEYIHAFDVFPKRGVEVFKTLRLQREMMKNNYPCRILRWDGRAFCRFPTPTIEYAGELLKSLWQWREELQ